MTGDVHPAPRAMAGRTASAALVLVLCGCVELPEFPRPSRIDRPRVLALVAEPPEVHPGQPVELSLLVAGAERHRATWRACAGFDAFGGSQYGDDEPDEGCGAGVSLPLGEGATATLPGAVSARLFADLELAAMLFGDALPDDAVARVREQVGLAFLIEADVETDGKRIRSVKRVLISERPSPHRNPPPPHFRLGATEVAAVPGERFRCAGPDGAAPRAPTAAEVELAPVVDGDEEAWLERYHVLDARGDLRERTERAHYAWFSTHGELEQGTTRSPLRNEIWRTPAQPACVPLWVVVRDGHGGTSACRVEVAVGDARCEP